MTTADRALAARLKQADEGDHERGCQGREYTCTCGYDEAILTAASEASTALTSALDEIERLEKALGSLVDGDCTYDGNRIIIQCESHSEAITRMRLSRAALHRSGR